MSSPLAEAVRASIKILKGLMSVWLMAPYLPRTEGVPIQTHLRVNGLAGEEIEVMRVEYVPYGCMLRKRYELQW